MTIQDEAIHSGLTSVSLEQSLMVSLRAWLIAPRSRVSLHGKGKPEMNF